MSREGFTVIAAAMMSAISMSAFSASVDFNTAVSTVHVGDTFAIDINGTGFLANLDGGGFNLNYDPAVVKVNSLVIDSTKWELAPSSGTKNDATGTITDVSFNTFVNNNLGNFHIADLSITALALGSSSLTLTESANFPFASGGNLVHPTLSSGIVNVTAVVPLPPAVWMLLSGVLGVVGFHRASASS